MWLLMSPRTSLQYVRKIGKNKVTNAISTVTGKQPTQQVRHYCHREKQKANIEQPNIINQYNMSMREVDRMDQNISAYMINLCTKKWWWPLFWVAVDVAVSYAYQINRQSHLNLEEYRLGALGFRRVIVDTYYRLYRKSFPSTTLFTGRPSLHHSANNFESDGINHWITATADSNSVAYPDVKKPWYIIAKNAMLVMLNVLNHITVSKAVCKVYWR